MHIKRRSFGFFYSQNNLIKSLCQDIVIPAKAGIHCIKRIYAKHIQLLSVHLCSLDICTVDPCLRRDDKHLVTSVTFFTTYLGVALLVLFAKPAMAADSHKSAHGAQIFHMMRLETNIGANRDGTLYSWDLDGWVGTDENKMWLKVEGAKEDGKTAEKAEYWAMYSRNVSQFWDAQGGIRFDEQPNSTTYFVAGINGLAPYFFETEAHIFLSEDGDVAARLRQENDFLITQRLIIQPYMELNFSAQDVPELEIGQGITSGEFGAQTRYEITRQFAPYIDLRYERKFGETSTIARKHSENRDDAIASVGLRLMF